MRAAPWTEQRIELLQRLRAEGASARAIADRLGGVSRSAVMGKIFRLRAAALARTQAVEATPPPHSPGRRRRRGKTLLQLANHCCRWVVEGAVKWLVAATLSHFQ